MLSSEKSMYGPDGPISSGRKSKSISVLVPGTVSFLPSISCFQCATSVDTWGEICMYASVWLDVRSCHLVAELSLECSDVGGRV